MHGLVVIEGMDLSGHPWIINEILCAVASSLQIVGQTKADFLRIWCVMFGLIY